MSRKLIYKRHAIHRMAYRDIDESVTEHIFKSGEIIEKYSDDTPYPSYLILGFWESHPIHMVLADNPFNDETYVITVYKPNSSEWNSTFKKKRDKK